MLRRLVPIACAAAVGLLATAPSAAAHTVFNSSEPADGSVLAVAPPAVVLEFSSSVDLGFTWVQMVDGAGHTIVGLTPTINPDRPGRLVVGLPPLHTETYQLSFRTRDPVDLHQNSSSVVFGVGTSPTLAAARPSVPGPQWTEVALRWLARGGLSLALGALVIALLVAPKALARSRLTSLQAALFGVAAVGVVTATAGDTGLLALQASRIGPLNSSFGRVVSQSDFGRRWLIGLQLAAGAALVLAWLRARARAGFSPWKSVLAPPDRRRRIHPAAVIAVCLVVAQVVAVGTSGHISEGNQPKAVGVALLSAHLLAVGAWIGALAALIYSLAWLTHRPEPAGRDAKAMIEAFSPVAAVGLIVVAISGLLLSGQEVDTVTALLSSAYGIILLAKVAVVAVAAAFGAHHYRRIRRDNGWQGRRSLKVEAAFGALAIFGGAALAAAAPALGPQYRTGKAAPSASVLTSNLSDLVVRVSLRPDHPGPNLLAVDVFNTRRPVPAPIAGVTITMTSPGTAAKVVTLPPGDNGHFDGGTVDLAPGPLTVTVAVHRPGMPDVEGTLPWGVNGPQPYRQPTILSAARLAPMTTAAAAAIALLALVLLAIARWPRSRPLGPPSQVETGGDVPASEPGSADLVGATQGFSSTTPR